MKHLLTICIFLFCMALQGHAQASRTKNEPLFILDGNRVGGGTLQNTNPMDIAAIEVIKDSTALLRFGNEGRNGVILITTKKHAREKYMPFLQSKSAEYAKAVANSDDERKVVYIFNGEVLADGYEGSLYTVSDSNLVLLTVIDGQQLQDDYNVPGKKYGIVIVTNKKSK